MRTHLSTASLSGLPAQDKLRPISLGPENGHKSRELEHLCYEKGMTELVLFSLEKNMVLGDLSMKEAYKIDEKDFLPRPSVAGQGTVILN